MALQPACRAAAPWLVFVALAVDLSAAGANPPRVASIAIRGHEQHLQIYGPADGPVAIVSSGDGGWMHLGPHIAETLAARGYRVIGFDVRNYLASFTTSTSTLTPQNVASDYLDLINLIDPAKPGAPVNGGNAAGSSGSRQPVTLLGVSEGASLSVLAATDPRVRARIQGVVGLGLPDEAELGWRWIDTVIYVTHGQPWEPMFSTASVVRQMAGLPLAAIHSTHDEYVPLDEVGRVMAAAGDPKRLWVIPAANHRFSDNLGACDTALFEALAWIHDHRR
jgi:pimeloyl-ACP methyl ester carboxylesterase